MANPVSITVDEQTHSIYVLFDDGSVDTIRSVLEPHDPEPAWREIAPPNPKALIERVIRWDAEASEALEPDETSEAAPGTTE